MHYESPFQPDIQGVQVKSTLMFSLILNMLNVTFLKMMHPWIASDTA